MKQKVVSFSSFCMFLLGQLKTVEQQKETFQISFYNELFSINTEITFVLKKAREYSKIEITDESSPILGNGSHRKIFALYPWLIFKNKTFSKFKLKIFEPVTNHILSGPAGQSTKKSQNVDTKNRVLQVREDFGSRLTATVSFERIKYN